MISCFRLSDNEKFSLKEISEFNDARYEIRAPHDVYDKYRFEDNPYADEKKDYLYCATDDGKHVGQMLTLPNPLTLNGEIFPSYWGQDLYVLEDYRRKGINNEFSKFYLNKGYYSAVGLSKFSTITHEKQGIRKAVNLDVYIKWASFLHQIKFLIHRGLKIKPKKIMSYQFPEETRDFVRVTDVEKLNFPNLNWNRDVVEPIRDKTYFKWRFFYKPDRYFVYQSKIKTIENSTYFILKPYFFKGVNWLRVVDYRFDNRQPEEFSKILSATEELRKRFDLFGTIITSSQKISTDLLSRDKFILHNRKVVVTNFPFQHSGADKPHNHFMISFADSDLDMHTNLGKFNYAEDY